MAVLGWRRVLTGTGFSGKVGEPLRFDEAWLIRVTTLTEPRLNIIRAVPCGWYASHWEIAACKAMEFKLAPTTKEGLLWRLDVAFYPPPPSAKLTSTGVPEDYWDRTGGATSVPVFRDRDGVMIVNAAGDPVEGLQKEREEKTWTLTKFYQNDTWKSDVTEFDGSVNSDTWDGESADKWKCYFKSAKRREIQSVARTNGTASSAVEGEPSTGGTDDTLTVVETAWEFRFERDTWKCMPWDVGFHELVGGQRKAILGADGKAVKQPVSLNANGTAKADGQPPSVIRNGEGAKLYFEKAFGAKFGSPFIYPQA
jgi:hypothetical protein